MLINKKDELIKEGLDLPFQDTFCKACVENGQSVLVISDITKNDWTKDLPITRQYGRGCFIGIPINFKDGENYGTVCGFDLETYEFEPSHIALFQSIASQLSYVLELERAQKQVETLSAPFVPIKKGLAVLPVIGILNETLLHNMVQLTLKKCQTLSLDYLIIDLSGVQKINTLVVDWLFNLVHLLKLMGVTPIITGITPEFAMKTVHRSESFGDIMVEINLENVLKKMGVYFETIGDGAI